MALWTRILLGWHVTLDTWIKQPFVTTCASVMTCRCDVETTLWYRQAWFNFLLHSWHSFHYTALYELLYTIIICITTCIEFAVFQIPIQTVIRDQSHLQLMLYSKSPLLSSQTDKDKDLEIQSYPRLSCSFYPRCGFTSNMIYSIDGT